MLIHMVGPNAVGKTTAAKRMDARYRQYGLRTVCCDINWVADPDGERRQEGWKGTIETKIALAKEYQKYGVCLIESMRTASLYAYDPSDRVVVLVSPADSHRERIRQRCIDGGRKFNEEYWDKAKCVYEGEKRYTNFMEKRSIPYHSFYIVEYNDWNTVDRYLSTLIREELNRSNRS